MAEYIQRYLMSIIRIRKRLSKKYPSIQVSKDSFIRTLSCEKDLQSWNSLSSCDIFIFLSLEENPSAIEYQSIQLSEYSVIRVSE